MTLYEAIERRAQPLARLTDDLPAMQRLVRLVAIGAARWSEKSRCDIARARVQVVAERNVFVLRLSERPSLTLLFRSPIVTTFATSVRFITDNPDGIGAIETLVRWALPLIGTGATRFDARWSPGAEGFLAITATADIARSA